MGRYAAIDIGTVTCRLFIADVDEGGLHELVRRSSIVNLGEGVDATGVLKPQAMERVRACVAQYQEIIESYASPDCPIALTAVATSASRDAENADEFARILAGEGVQLSVIPGTREAALSFMGASCDFVGERLLVVDSGGGSTEVIAGVGGEDPLVAHSFDIGCRRVTERLLAGDPPTDEELQAARELCQRNFQPFFDRLADRGFVPERMVAVAGTATSVVSVHEAMDPYDSSRVHGYCVSRDVLHEETRRLAGMTLEQRRTVTGLQPDRAPVIVAGMEILGQVLDCSGLGSFTVSESDILQGIIMAASSGRM